MASESDTSSIPLFPDNDSPGSSVSSSLQREYEELLKYAVVTPRLQIAKSIYEQTSHSQPKKPSRNNGELSGETTEVSSKSEVSSSSKSTTTDSSRSTYMEEVSRVAREDVAGLPNTPAAPISVSLMGAGSLARNSLLRESSTPIAERASFELANDSGSSEKSSDSPGSVPPSPTVDGDLVRMEALLDSWCLDLKRNVLAEFAQCKMGMFEMQKQLMIQEKRRHMADRNKLLNEMESQKELLYTYEQTIGHKDSILTNMTNALQRQRDKLELLRNFSSWKLKHNDETRERFASKLAEKHHQHALKAKSWASWRGMVESKWKHRVEMACQTKSQEVCIKLTEDYETKLETANHELDQARQEIAHLHAEREMYEETMKKAFMRGVCALNVEAMSMFREGEEGGRKPPAPPSVPQQDRATSHSDPENMPRHRAPPQPIATTSSHPVTSVPYKTTTQMTGRKITVRATGREDLKGPKATAGLMGHQGPVSSVLVQRHTTEQSSAPSLPSRHTSSQPSTRTSKTSQSVPVKTVHTMPLKVVH